MQKNRRAVNRAARPQATCAVSKPPGANRASDQAWRFAQAKATSLLRSGFQAEAAASAENRQSPKAPARCFRSGNSDFPSARLRHSMPIDRLACGSSRFGLRGRRPVTQKKPRRSASQVARCYGTTIARQAARQTTIAAAMFPKKTNAPADKRLAERYDDSRAVRALRRARAGKPEIVRPA